VPDVHVCAEGVPFWMELKVTKTNAINISPHQIAWNHAYCQAGGVSFFLIHPLLSHGLYLFDGIKGRELAKSGLRGISLEPGSGVVPLWSGESESGLLVGALEIARSRVGSGRDQSGRGRGASRVWLRRAGPGLGCEVRASRGVPDRQKKGDPKAARVGEELGYCLSNGSR